MLRTQATLRSHLQIIEPIRRDWSNTFAYLELVFSNPPKMANQDDFAPLIPASWVKMQETSKK